MKNLCQKYISDVKSFFPVMGKEEKKYLANLKNTVEEYCNEENITTIDKLYEGFGYPHDVVCSYYSKTDIQEIIKQISHTKYIKRGISAFVGVLLVALIVFSINVYYTYYIFAEEQISYEKTIFSDPESDMIE